MISTTAVRLAAVLTLSLPALAAAQTAPTPTTPTTAAQPSPPPSGGTPDKIPYDLPYGAPIALERAKQVLAAAEAEAGKRNWKMNIAVVDTHGELVHFVRMDGAQLSSIAISQNKARTSARWRRESRVFYNAYETGHPYIGALDPQLAPSPGGFPLVENGTIIGAIGCSGGTGDQDAVICKVGADIVK